MAGTQDYAVAAKVRAMYGKRITAEDYRRIAGMRNVGEIAAYLRNQPSYAAAMEDLAARTVDRLALESAIKNNMMGEYFRILNFIGREDMAVMRFLVASAELREIMRFIWLAESGHPERYILDMPPYFNRYSKINYSKLGGAVNYAGLLEAVRDTPYRAPLEALELRPGGWPEYAKAEVAIRRSYYHWVMSVIDRNYAGERRAALRDAVGFEIDIVNIMAIFRIRRHFPKVMEEIAGYLLPISYKLKPAVVKKLLAAPDEPAMLEVLRGAGYRRIFSGKVYDEVDGYYFVGMIGFYRRQIRSGKPYVATPMAYLFLKQLENKNLVKLIECVQYGIPPEKAAEFLYPV